MNPRHVTVLVAFAMALPAFAATAQVGDPGPHLGDRVFALVMEHTRFNGRTWPDTPLLEAYAGEDMHFIVHVPVTAEPHTFHLHGHPWEDPESGNMIDAILLMPGETHRFTVNAGLGRGFAGDWLYHCHVELHFGEGMWGILRVYPFALDVTGGADVLRVSARDADGRGVPVDAVTLTLDGRAVDATVTRAGPGDVTVRPALPAEAAGTLVVTARSAAGEESVARLALDGAGGFTALRNAGPVADFAGNGVRDAAPDTGFTLTI